MNPTTITEKPRLNILVVEDSPTEAEQLRLGLEDRGYAVDVARDGSEGLSMARAHPPALIVSDVIMPEMDGYTLCRNIKADTQLSQIPVILVTALSSAPDVIKGLECGADNFVRKPYELDYLESRIDYIIRNRELRTRRLAQSHVGVEPGLEVYFNGQRHFITSERQQILDLLISTYEQAVLVNGQLTAKEKELLQSYERLDGLYRLAGDLSRAETPSEVLEMAVQHAVGWPGVTAAWICLRENREGLRLTATRGVPPALQNPALWARDCYCQRQLLRGQLDRATIIHECDRWQKIDCGAIDLRCQASMPLLLGDQIIGILNVATDKRPMTTDNLTVLSGVASQASTALARAQLREQLAASNAELESFAYSVSHDLRAPLRHLDGFAQMLVKHTAGTLDDTAVHYVRTICAAATKMGRLIDDLLALSRTSRTEMRTQRVALNALVAEVQQELTAGLDNRTVTWVIGPLPTVEGDPGLLRIVFMNLLSNAVKFTAPRPEARIEVGSTTGEPGEVVIFVRDNGVGFDMQYVSKLFGVFQRLHAAEQFEGTGIGLATVRRIVHRHGGRVWAEGEVDCGASFYFSVKAVPPCSWMSEPGTPTPAFVLDQAGKPAFPLRSSLQDQGNPHDQTQGALFDGRFFVWPGTCFPYLAGQFIERAEVK